MSQTINLSYELHHHERKHFVKLFLESMINAPKELWHPVMIVVDEAHVFAPEKGQSEAMDAVIDLATRGRKRGYCAVLATQRVSKLHSNHRGHTRQMPCPRQQNEHTYERQRPSL